MLKDDIKELIIDLIEELQETKEFPNFKIPEITVEYPREKSHGDYSTGVALQLVKNINKRPIEIASLLAKQLNILSKDIFEKVEAVQPGFVNFFVRKEYLQSQLKEILKQKEKFGSLDIGEGKKVNVEFISANPTGPLTLGNGRGGFCGDVLANVLAKAGYKVTREYYVNDRGEQIIKLGHSVLMDSEAVYKGKYIEELNEKMVSRNSPIFPEKVGGQAANYILEKMIKPSVKKMGIKFDVWFSEKTLYQDGSVDKAIKELTAKEYTYNSEGALWFKSKDIDDDKDRVLVRADGEKTYFASDIAYLINKFSRGFDKLFLFFGADHYGYVARLKAAAEALGYDKNKIETIVFQLVRLFKDGQEQKMSKRAGTYITMDELLDEASLDAARFFFLMRGANTHLNFDMNLAKEQSSKNPVFYVQYGYARISSILRKKKPFLILKPDFKLLRENAELNLIKQLVKMPEVVENISQDYQVQRLTQYSTELADAFHQFYEKCRVISEDKKLTQARLALVLATKIVFKNVLNLMGISAPDKM